MAELWQKRESDRFMINWRVLLRVGFGLLLVLSLILAGVRPYPDSAAVSAQSGLLTTHPRLFFDASQIPELRARAATTHQQIWKPIRDYAESMLGTRPPPDAPLDSGLDFLRDQGSQLIALSFACVISDRDDLCDLATSYLMAVVNWTRWDFDGRGLVHSHLLLGSVLAYDWLYDRLAPEEQRIAQTNLARRTYQLYEASAQPYENEWQNWWHRSYLQNHFFIANSVLGIAGLALLSDVEDLRAYCTVIADHDVNLRTGPGTDHAIAGVFRSDEEASVIGETRGADGYRWWQLADQVWVRSDVVIESELCEQVFSPQLWVDHARQRIATGSHILDSISDGSWHEGMIYQDYLLTMSLPFMTNLRRLEFIDILPHMYLRNYALWRVYNTLPNGDHILLYGNFEWTWRDAYGPQSILRFIAGEYGDGYAEWLAQDITTREGRIAREWRVPWYVFEFLYYDPLVGPRPPDDLPSARIFPDIEAVVWRTGWGEDSLVFGLKSGPLGGRFAFDTFVQEVYPWNPPCTVTQCSLNIGHDHNDTNSFYLFANGQWLVPETVGYGQVRTSLHNTILVDGQGQYRPPDSYYGERPEDLAGSDGYLEHAVNSPDFNYVAANATRRYKQIAGLNDITRHVVFVAPDYFVMLDNLAADAPHMYEWIAHFGMEVSLEDGWIYGEAEAQQALGIGIVAPQPFELATGNDGTPYVRVSPVAPVDNMLFIHVLYPTTASAWNTKPSVSITEDNGAVVALHVQRQDGSQRSDDIVLTYADASVESAAGAYRFDGQVAVITSDGAGALEKLWVYGGTYLRTEGAAGSFLVNNLHPQHPFQATYHDGVVEVSGAVMAEITLYAPGVEQLVLNGQTVPFDRSGDYITFGR